MPMKTRETGQMISGVDAKTRLPYGVSRYYESLAESSDPHSDPIAAQFVPRIQEQTVLECESSDPISDVGYSVARRVIHHYNDRILILVNDRCATYCRHCFRRHFTGNDSGRLTHEELQRAAEYISATERVQEVLLSGGDPLMLPDRDLQRIIMRLRDAAGKRTLLFRVASRMPVVLPSRITPALVDVLREASDSRIWLVTHANHPRELTPQSARAAKLLVDGGIPVLNQAVLLKGINNDADALEELFRGLIQLRVKPYYLFQGDLASGTSHFRTSIEEGLDLMDQLRRRLSGIAMPTYAVDLPGGGGKIPLTRASVAEVRQQEYILTDSDGNRYSYPRELTGE